MRLRNEKMLVHRCCEDLHVCPTDDRNPDAPKFEWPSDWSARECVMCFDSIPVDSAEFLKEKSEFAVCFPCYAYMYANLPCETARTANTKKRAAAPTGDAERTEKNKTKKARVKRDAKKPTSK